MKRAIKNLSGVYVTVNVINWELCIFPGYYV